MCTVLGWTLEVNHFFISMFGNTLAFSKLPLRDIIMLQKDIMTKFLLICNELFDFACKVNADSKYKWHKNLQMCENQLKRLKFHVEKCLSLISCIDSEHLDYDTQMRRLRDVHARFQPLMSRIDNSLGVIQIELNLPATHRHSLEQPNAHSVTTNNNNSYTQGQSSPTTNNGNPNMSYLQIQEGDRRPPSGALALPRGDEVKDTSLQSIAASKGSQPINRTTSSIPTPPNNNNNTSEKVMPIAPGGIFSRGQSPDTIPSNHSNPLSPLSQSPVNDRTSNINNQGIAQQGYSETGMTSGGASNNSGGYIVQEVDSDNDGEGMGGEEEGELMVREGQSSTVCVIS